MNTIPEIESSPYIKFVKYGDEDQEMIFYESEPSRLFLPIVFLIESPVILNG